MPRCAVLLAAAALVGCGTSTSGHGHTAAPSNQRPGAVLTLPAPAGRLALPDATRPITLHPGQLVAVQSMRTDGPGYWHQTSAGDRDVLVPAGSMTVGACPAGQVGCSAKVQTRYRAAAPGSTTVVWTYSGLGPGASAAPGRPTEPCSGDSAARCPVGRVRIAVTVEP